MHVQKINIKNRGYNYYFGNLVKHKKIRIKNILIDKKIYKDLMIYFTRCVRSKSIKTLSLHYPELMEKLKNTKGKKYLMVNDYMLDKVLHKTK